jgi:competence protein ComEA
LARHNVPLDPRARPPNRPQVSGRAKVLTKEDRMFRQCLPALAIVSLFAVAPTPSAAQTSHPSSSKAAVTSAIVNINTASASDLEALPGIGAKTAARIVEYRQKNGPFKKIEELMNVRGVGEKNFLKLKPQITIASKPEGASAAK